MLSKRQKVFGIGLSRTGTASLAVALRQLGFTSLHWPHDSRTQAELMVHYMHRGSPLDLTVAREYDAVTDTPVSSVYHELSYAYPESTFVLTVRDRALWLDACETFWSLIVEPLYRRNAGNPFGQYVKTVHQELYGTQHFDRRRFSDAYEHHIRNVQRRFEKQPQRLLILDICSGDTWKHLCTFLEVTTPEAPFPHVNRLETVRSVFDKGSSETKHQAFVKRLPYM